MATSTLLATGLSKLTSYVNVGIRENINATGGFLIDCILAQLAANPKNKIILVCGQHNWMHYLATTQRVGCNLKAARDRNSLLIIDLLENGWMFEPDTLFSNLAAQIEEMTKSIFSSSDDRHLTIIFDDLSFFSYLNLPEERICEFLFDLFIFLKDYKNVTIVQKLNISDDFNLLNEMIQQSEIDIEVSPLKSGNFKDVNGRVVIKTKQTNEEKGFEIHNKTIFVSIQDRSIKHYSPGEFGLKI